MAREARALSGRYDVAVIGGGHNGLTAAALLARAGRRVVVLERRLVLGGLAAAEPFHPGYRSPGVLHDTSGVSEEVVEALALEKHGLSRTAAPAVFVPETNGSGLALHHDAGAAAAEISRLSPSDAERYGEYRAFLRRLEAVGRRLLDQPPPDILGNGRASLFELLAHGLALRRLGRRDLRELLRIVPMSAGDWLSEWFESDLLRSALAAPALEATFMGPRSPGSNAALLRFELLGQGRAIAGGGPALVAALERAARALGVEIRTASEVAEIRVAGGAVEGVRLVGGEAIDAAIVAASCDVRRTFLALVHGRHVPPRLEHRISRWRSGGTTAVVNVALREPLRFDGRPGLAVERARIGEALDDLERAFDPIKYGLLPDRPFLDVLAVGAGGAGEGGPGAAPPGLAVLSVLVHHVPTEPAGGWTDEQRRRLGETVLATLARYAGGVRAAVVAHEVLVPPDLEERYGVSGGHLHHGEHSLDQLLVRPSPQCARHATPIGGLYLCGSGSHPGGGLTCRPGRLAARAIIGRR